jgi:hypothetical protein
MVVGKKFIEDKVPDFSKQTVKEKIGLVEAVVADDLSTLLGVGWNIARPYIMSAVATYGPKILDWLYNHSLNRLKSVHSSGSGVGLKTTVDSIERPIYKSQGYGNVYMNSCSTECIASWICPEIFSSLIPDG